MFKMTILFLTVCLCSGCTISPRNNTVAPNAFWGRRVEADGTEYLRIGGSEFQTRTAATR